MIINVHAGHNADGKTACGAVGFIKESTQARKVKDEVIKQLKGLGHTVYDCTVDNAANVSANLSQIVNKCNAHKADLDVSIHFNAGASDSKGNGKTTGTEVLLYNIETSKAKKYAEAVCKEISKLGFANRGLKERPGLYVLRHTNSPAMLIECCFVDDNDDVQLYDYKKMADAIVRGIVGKNYEDKPVKDSNKEAEKPDVETKTGDGKAIYRVQVGAYSIKENAEILQKKLKNAGFDAIIVKG